MTERCSCAACLMRRAQGLEPFEGVSVSETMHIVDPEEEDLSIDAYAEIRREIEALRRELRHLADACRAQVQDDFRRAAAARPALPANFTRRLEEVLGELLRRQRIAFEERLAEIERRFALERSPDIVELPADFLRH